MEYRFAEGELPEIKRTVTDLIERGIPFEAHWVDMDMTNISSAYFEILTQED